MTKQKGKSTKRNSGLGQRLLQLLAQFDLSQKEAALLCIDEEGKPTKLSVFHNWCNGANPTRYKPLKSLCEALSERGKEKICFEWLLTGEVSTPSVPVLKTEADLAKLFLHEDQVFDGFVHVKVTKVSLKKN